MKYTIQQATDFQIKIKIALDYIMINRYFGRLQLEHLNSFKIHYCSFHINKKIGKISVFQCDTFLSPLKFYVVDEVFLSNQVDEK